MFPPLRAAQPSSLFEEKSNSLNVFTFTQPTLPGLSPGTNQFALSYSLGSPNIVPDGIYNVYLTAIDAAGNTLSSNDPNSPIPIAQTSLELVVDRTPPVVSNVEVAPFEVPASNPKITVVYGVNENQDAPELQLGERRGAAPTVKVDIEDPQGRVVFNSIPGGADFNNTNLVAITLPTGLAPGQYVSRVTATDWAGNQTSSIASLVFQSIPPQITSPSMGATVAGNVVIQGRAVDPDWTTPNSFLGYSLYYISGTQSLPATNLLSNAALTVAGWKGGADTRISVPSTYQIAPSGSVSALNHSFQPITSGTLGYWDTNAQGSTIALADGNYTLLLVVADTFNNGGTAVTEYQGFAQPVTVSHETVVVPPLDVLMGAPVPSSPMTFSPNPADPANAVTFSYGLSGQAANTRFELLDSTGRSVLTNTASNVSATPIQFYGKPTIPTSGLGYWIWYDSTGWHLRFQSDGNQHSFTASMTSTNGEVVNVMPVSLENLNAVTTATSGTAIDQLFPAPGGTASFLTLTATRVAGIPAFQELTGRCTPTKPRSASRSTASSRMA